jgi:hypothetical protein
LEDEFGGLGCDFPHFAEQGAGATVVVDPFAVELGLPLG